MLSSDKYAGGVVGFRGGPCSSTSAAADANVEESLVADDGKGVLNAVLTADGRIGWKTRTDVDAAFRRTVAMSQMSSMLKDTYRNQCYAGAIEKCVSAFVASTSSAPTVMDVGAGTGLLSLLSARAGAQFVHGAEQWSVMAGIADQVVKSNPPLDERIRIHATHSSALGVESGAPARKRSPLAPAGPASDPYSIPRPVDLVVSEILDSALLGEGVIPSLSHAFNHLSVAANASKDSKNGKDAGSDDNLQLTAVPLSARVYGQLLSSADVFDKWGNTARAAIKVQVRTTACSAAGVGPEEGDDCDDEPIEVCLARKDWQERCACNGVAIPVHIDRLPKGSVTPVSNVFLAANIHFTAEGVKLIEQAAAAAAEGAPAEPSVSAKPAKGSDVPSSPRQILRVPATKPGVAANALVFWWRCTLWKGSSARDDDIDIEYCTCAGCVDKQGWQDHWVQCAIPLSQPIYPAKKDAEASYSKDMPAETAAVCYETGDLIGRCPGAAGAKEVVSAVGDAGESFLVALDTLPMALVFRVAPGSAEVWPSKRMRNRAVKEGKAKKLQLGSDAPALTALTTPPLYLDEPETCTCGLHSLYSVDRRWAMADGGKRWKAFGDGLVAALEQAGQAHSAKLDEEGSDNGSFNVVSLGDGAVAGLIAAVAMDRKPEAFGLPAPATDDGDEGDDDDEDEDGDVEQKPPVFRVVALEDSRLAAVHTDALAQAHGLEADLNFATAIVPAHVPGATAKADSSSEDEGLLSTAFEAYQQMCSGGEDIDVEEADDEAAEAAERAQVVASREPFADAVVVEPLFARMHTHPLWCAVSAWRRSVALRPAMKPGAVVFPSRARVCVQAVHFTHLAHNHGTVGSVCGFDHKPFDDVEQEWHTHTFTYPLHQYEHRAVSEPQCQWALLDYTKDEPTGAVAARADGDAKASAGAGQAAASTAGQRWAFETTLTLQPATEEAPTVAHGVMFWVEWDGGISDANTVLTTHPVEAPYTRQHVRFFREPLPVASGTTVRVSFTLQEEDGGAFSFDLDAQPAAS